MNENIDLTKILKGCPKGTKLYTSMFGYVFFERIEYGYVFCERRYGSDAVTFCITSNGKYDNSKDAEFVIFPSKENRDWSKFEMFWDKQKVEKFDPKTLQPFDKVLVRVDKNDCWMAAHFSHVDDYTHKAVCNTFHYTQCVPYNEETKHLVGTSEDCPEYYKWWEV